MTVLVADVGGTNSRLALVRPGQGPSATAAYANDAFGSFTALAEAFLRDRGAPVLDGCCIAIAGPVADNRGRLTNRDWRFDPAEIAARLPGLAGQPVRLVNDLAALGHALPGLAPGQVSDLRPVPAAAAGNGQALVVGAGTGFNACQVLLAGAPPVVFECELGHASLPANVQAVLVAEIGPVGAAHFFSNEELFSGRGLSRLHAVVSGGATLSGPQILGGFDPARGDAAARSLRLMARLLGLLTRELAFCYMPMAGIHFAGGVARGVLGSAARHEFLAAFDAPGPFADQLAGVPLRLIADDAAALTGAAAIARRGQ